MRTGTNTHPKRWFTTSLFSNVLLASSLQHPFVTADRCWQQHPSILPLSSVCQPTLCSPQLWPPPLELALSRSEVRIVHECLPYWCGATSLGGAWFDARVVRSRHKAFVLSSQPASRSSAITVVGGEHVVHEYRGFQPRLVSDGESLRHAVTACPCACVLSAWYILVID